MLARCKGTLLVISLLLITSCTSAEHKEALRLYELARSSKDIQQLTIALNTLAQLAPEKYQAELAKAQKAKKLLEQAQQHQTQGDDYSAYLSSHESYRSIPSFDSKQILLSSGKVLLPLLKAQLSIDKSLNIHTNTFQQEIDKYNYLPIRDWNVIDVNSNIEKLSIAIKESAIAYAWATKINSQEHSIPNLGAWQSSVRKHQILLTELRKKFVGLAQYHSAKLLLRLNNNLTTESKKVLALVRPKLAKESMQKSFNKSQELYASFQNIIENIALAENLSHKDKHADWYIDWHDLEKKILEPQGNFKDYPMNREYRNKQLLKYLNNNKAQLTLLTEAYNSKFNQEFGAIVELTSKLKKDKLLIF